MGNGLVGSSLVLIGLDWIQYEREKERKKEGSSREERRPGWAWLAYRGDVTTRWQRRLRQAGGRDLAGWRLREERGERVRKMLR